MAGSAFANQKADAQIKEIENLLQPVPQVDLSTLPKPIQAEDAVMETGRQGPIVEKFRGNIYSEEYFQESVYYDYLNAFWTGYNMQSYNWATECLDNFSLLMDSLHKWHLTSTRRKSNVELWDLWFTVAGTDANEAWYRCTLYWWEISATYATKWETFNDFGDIWLSFVFNMMANSINIKSQTENMIDAYDIHDTTTFTQSLGSVLRSILDFNSYTSTAAGSLDEASPIEQFLGYSSAYAPGELTKWERLEAYEKKLEEQQERIRARKAEERANGSKRVMLGEDYQWGVRDYV